jgi:hypothetical protein
MTEQERRKLRRALRLLYKDDGFDEAIIIIADLAGVRTALHELSKMSNKSVSLAEVATHIEERSRKTP